VKETAPLDDTKTIPASADFPATRDYFLNQPSSDLWDGVIQTPGDFEPLDDELIHASTTIEEALTYYNERYPKVAIDAGTVSPQLGISMLLNIHKQFASTITEEKQKVLTDLILGSAQGIIDLADKKPDDPGDRASIKGVFELVNVIGIAEHEAPEQIPYIEEGLKHVLSTVEHNSRIPMNEVKRALRYYDQHPDESLPDLVASTHGAELTEIQNDVEEELINHPEIAEQLFEAVEASSKVADHQRREIGQAALHETISSDAFEKVA
jgi:hypothetical protein